MKRRGRHWLTGLAVAVAIAGAVWWGVSRRARPVPLTIFFSGDTQGRLEPCGCFAGQFGGLGRMETQMQRLAGINNLRVDVGDSLPGTADYQRIGYNYVLRGFATMGYDAVNIGHRELKLPLVTLRDFGKTSPVPLISANVLDASTGEPVLPPYVMVERGGRRIAIVGVVDPRGTADGLGEGLLVNRMEVAIANVLPAVAKADLRVLLAFADEGQLASLAEEFSEFEVILGGDVSQPSQELTRRNRSIILYVTNEARALGTLRGWVKPGGGFEYGDFDVQLLQDTIPQDRRILHLVREYRAEIKQTELAIDATPPAGSTTYVGSGACFSCHEEAAKVWAVSAHAHAFMALKDKGADFDPQCLPCHVVGLSKPGGYSRSSADSNLADVGCESCHGPGSEHVKQRQGNEPVLFRYRPLGAGDCQRCHYGEYSRPFEWQSFWEPIKH